MENCKGQKARDGGSEGSSLKKELQTLEGKSCEC